MPDTPTPHPRHVLEALLLAFFFAVAHTQSPLYFSNQNQYLLHGLAAGGLGHLHADWLANTRDPTPVFSWLVEAGYTAFGEGSFQGAYFVLLMGYFLSVRWLVGALPGTPDTFTFRLLFAAGFTAAHAAILRWASVQLTGVDYPWYMQAGVAAQYVLGPGLQPSAFGVLLVTALAAFANGRPVLAAALAAAACVFHSTYLLPAGLFTLGFLTQLVSAGRTRTAITAGVVALLVVAPVLAHALATFRPTDSATFSESQRILAEVRIPHHAVVARWFDVVAGLQLAWVALGLFLLRRTPLFLVLLVPSVGGLLLTLLPLATGNPTLALLFPWRVSVVLVPVATAVIVAKGAGLLGGEGTGRSRNPARWASAVTLLALAVGGVIVMTDRLGHRTSDDELPLYSFVRASAGPTDVYLLPVRIPAVGTGRGAVSTSFTPPPRPKPGSNLIPVDLQRFRLHAGAAAYADFKSVPYADAEVLEWFRRMRRCEGWYAGDWGPAVRDELRHEGVTHVVAPAAKPIPAGYLRVVHADPAYIVYEVE